MSPESPFTVLHVDDDDLSRGLTSLCLRQAGFLVREAATGADALRLAAEKPDLILLDVGLPDLSGFEVCRRLKADPATAPIPVLHFSGVARTSAERTQGLQGGADGYLTKPVEMPELIAQVRALLRARQAENAARRAAHEWQTTFDAIADAVFLLDPEDTLRRCNRVMAALLGKPPTSSSAGRSRGSPGRPPAPSGPCRPRRPGRPTGRGSGRWPSGRAGSA
jgi:DNA-binding response OmpR family regulator